MRWFSDEFWLPEHHGVHHNLARRLWTAGATGAVIAPAFGFGWELTGDDPYISQALHVLEEALRRASASPRGPRACRSSPGLRTGG